MNATGQAAITLAGMLKQCKRVARDGRLDGWKISTRLAIICEGEQLSCGTDY